MPDEDREGERLFMPAQMTDVHAKRKACSRLQICSMVAGMAWWHGDGESSGRQCFLLFQFFSFFFSSTPSLFIDVCASLVSLHY